MQSHDHRLVGARPADARHQDEVGNDEDDRRRDQQADVPVHDEFFAAHREAGKGVGGRQGEGQAKRGGAAADDHAAEQLRRVVAGVDEGVAEVAEIRLEEELRRQGVGFAGMAEGEQDKPENGSQEEDHDQGHEQVDDDLMSPLQPPHPLTTPVCDRRR